MATMELGLDENLTLGENARAMDKAPSDLQSLETLRLNINKLTVLKKAY